MRPPISPQPSLPHAKPHNGIHPCDPTAVRSPTRDPQSVVKSPGWGETDTGRTLAPSECCDLRQASLSVEQKQEHLHMFLCGLKRTFPRTQWLSPDSVACSCCHPRLGRGHSVGTQPGMCRLLWPRLRPAQAGLGRHGALSSPRASHSPSPRRRAETPAALSQRCSSGMWRFNC